jgi:hypothetical protein
MKLWLLTIMALLPAAALGQQTDFNLARNDAASVVATQTDAALSGNESDAPNDSAGVPTEESTLAQAPVSAPQKSQKSNPRVDVSGWPEIDGSNVGYIDKAVVASEVILRFETEIHNLTPDLAEFLVPECSCASPGHPGNGLPVVVKNLNAEILHLYGEYALSRRFSVFTEVPVRWIQPQSFSPTNDQVPSQGGLADVMAGFKFAVVASPRRYVTFELQSFFPSGDSSRGLGTHHYSVQPSILYYQRLTDRLTVESELGELHPIGGTPGFAGEVVNYGIGPSYKLFRWNGGDFSPLVEFIGWRVLNGMVTNAPQCTTLYPCSAASNLLNLKGGARVTFGSHNSIYAGYGRALTGLYWYLRVFRLEYRYSF